MELLDDDWFRQAQEVGGEPVGLPTFNVRAEHGTQSVDITLDLFGRVVEWAREGGPTPDFVLTGTADAIVDRLFGTPEERRQVHLDGALRMTGEFTRLIVLDFGLLNDDALALQAKIRAIGGTPPRALSPYDAFVPTASDRSAPNIDSLHTAAAAAQAVVDGNDLGIQLYSSFRGETVLNVAYGLAGEGAPITTETLVPWFCASKPLFTVPFARLWEGGVLTPDTSVSDFVPYMRENGKEIIRFRHLLTHTTGIDEPAIGTFLADDDEMRSVIADAPAFPERLDRQVNYSPFWAWFVLCDALEAAAERPWRELIDDVIKECGLVDTARTLDPSHRDRTSLINLATSPPSPMLIFNDSASACVELPGSSVRGPISELGRLYEGLLFNSALLGDVTVDALTSRRRVGLTWTSSPTSDWGLGFEIESRYLSPSNVVFGDHTSMRTFGHRGFQSSVGFADPDEGVVVAIFVNGMVPLPENKKRMVSLANAIYADLGLATKG